jgi:heme exporter protein A
MIIGAEQISKSFDRKLIFKNISLFLESSKSLAITGSNGSGKSTLLKILASINDPSFGTLNFTCENKSLDKIMFRKKIGFVSPYLQFYDDLTGLETIQFSLSAKGLSINLDKVEELFDYFAIGFARNQLVKTYSSGMIQRLRFVQALASSPLALFLDEPTSTLDESGKKLFWNKLEDMRSSTIILIASNDQDEIKFCSNSISIHNYQ